MKHSSYKKNESNLTEVIPITEVPTSATSTNTIETKEPIHNKNSTNRNTTSGNSKDSCTKDISVYLKRIFVCNLASYTTENTLKEIFSSYGDIVFLRILTNTKTGAPSGYGFIEFASIDSAEKAKKELHGFVVNNKPLIISDVYPRGSRKEASKKQCKKHKKHP